MDDEHDDGAAARGAAMTMALARTLMIQGTASSVGKSILVTALCRIFRNRGVRVAPFKAQNMSLNAAVTADGCEIGRAQAAQAEAAGVEPVADMNPVLLKPEGDARSQLVVLGRAIGSVAATDYPPRTPDLRAVIAASLERLRREFELVVIEGAGSPAEINLRDRDLVNMHVARLADAPVVLAADIDRGGVFAALLGTLALLEPDERARVRGLVINKFRGDVRLLEPGLGVLRERAGVPVLGVLPFIPHLRLAAEDSVALDDRGRRRGASPEDGARRSGPEAIEIAVVRLPRIANFDDFDPLDHEAGVDLRFVERPEDLATADLVILPGSKSTVADLRWLIERGLAAEIGARARRHAPVLGICGGCQMLGAVIEDPDGIESPAARIEGLGLLPIRTRFGAAKRTARVRAVVASPSFVADASAGELEGYEIHMGTVERIDGTAPPLLEVVARNGRPDRDLDGAVDESGAVAGTMLHALFENDALRSNLIASLRASKRTGRDERRASPEDDASPRGRSRGHASMGAGAARDAEYDRLASIVEAHLDMAAVARLIGRRW